MGLCGFLALFAFALIVVSLWKWMRLLWLGWKIPKTLLDTSYKHLFKIFTGDTKHSFNDFVSNRDKGISRLISFPMLMVNVASPENVKIVLNSRECMDKPYFIKQSLTLTQGTAFGDFLPWQRHRKILNPYFNAQGIRSFIPIVNEKMRQFMDNLKEAEGEGEFDILYNITALTLDSITSVMEYNGEFQKLDAKSREAIAKNSECFLDIAVMRTMRYWHHFDSIFKRSNLCARQIQAIANSAMKFAPAIMNQACARLTTRDTDSEKEKTFIRELVSPRNALSDAEIKDEINTLLVTAQDTPAVAVSVMLLLLAMHKDVQQKVVDELELVMGTEKYGYLDSEQLNELEYLEMVINEAMRLLPAVPMITRVNECDIMSAEGLTIPAGTGMIISIFNLHRSKEFWGDDADIFRPERFEREAFSKIHPYAFVPFVKGPRMCLGWRYAMMLMKILLANALLKYEFDTSLKLEELELKNIMVLKVCNGIRVSIRERRG